MNVEHLGNLGIPHHMLILLGVWIPIHMCELLLQVVNVVFGHVVLSVEVVHLVVSIL